MQQEDVSVDQESPQPEQTDRGQTTTSLTEDSLRESQGETEPDEVTSEVITEPQEQEDTQVFKNSIKVGVRSNGSYPNSEDMGSASVSEAGSKVPSPDLQALAMPSSCQSILKVRNTIYIGVG